MESFSSRRLAVRSWDFGTLKELGRKNEWEKVVHPILDPLYISQPCSSSSPCFLFPHSLLYSIASVSLIYKSTSSSLSTNTSIFNITIMVQAKASNLPNEPEFEQVSRKLYHCASVPGVGRQPSGQTRNIQQELHGAGGWKETSMNQRSKLTS